MNPPASCTAWAVALRGLLFAALTIAALSGGCGGGVGSGGTGSFAAGPITGFGSIIVSGIRFDDSLADVEDLDGQRRSRDELRLGMTVEVDSGPITTAAATAQRIRFESEMAGLVGIIDLAGSSFTLLGQRVSVDVSTVFDERLIDGLEGLRTGDRVEVYAVFDSSQRRFRATRVEPASLVQGLRLRGPLQAVNTTAQTLRIGDISYSYAGAADVPATLAPGQYVRLRLEADLLPAPRWVVRRFEPALRVLADADDVKIEGLVTDFGSPSSFSVNGRAVDGRGVGTPAGLAAGARVEVEGQLRSGVLLASRVTIKSDAEITGRGFDLEGTISSVDSAARRFVLRGVTVNTTRADLRFDGGTAADLQVGRRVEVQGLLSADRRSLDATRIHLR